MVDKELIEGLRTALSKGESLEQAMYTFFNAGYEKSKVEEAAKALMYQGQPEQMPQKPVPLQPRLKPKPQPIVKPGLKPESKQMLEPSMPVLPEKIKPQLRPAPPVSKSMLPPETSPEKSLLEPYIPKKPGEETPKEPSKQIVSGYEKQKAPKKKLAIVLLIIFLIVLLGGLASIFIFRQELIEIFNNLIESL